jgi:hypothetical protein
MKYLFIILSFVVLSTMLTVFFLWPTNSEDSSQGAARNPDHPQEKSYHQSESDERSSASKTRQLLVQEAQRVGIDKEDSFRKSLKEYYEQSLVKVLTDRKLAEIEVSVSEDDIDRYLSCSGKTFTFTRFLEEEGKVEQQNGYHSTVCFDDLSATLRLMMANLQPGESAKQFETGTETGVIRLDKIEVPDGLEAVAYDRDRIREQLENYQRSLEIDRWVNALQKKHSLQDNGSRN